MRGERGCESDAFFGLGATQSRRERKLCFLWEYLALVGLKLMHVPKYLLVPVTLSYLEVLFLDIIS